VPTAATLTEISSIHRLSVVRLFGIAVVVALAGRLVFALWYWVDKPLTIDQIEYLMLADNLRSGQGLVFDEGEHRLMRSPGYPVFLAAVLSLRDSLTAVRVAQSVLGALTVLLIAALAHRLAGLRAAVGAAFVAALYPPLVWMPAEILSETLFMVVSLSAALLLWHRFDALARSAGATRYGVDWPSLGIGGLMGLAVLVRPETLFFLGPMATYLVLRRQWAPAAALIVGTILVVAPWTATNYLRHGELIFVSSRGGPNFWMGNSALSTGDGDVGSNPELRAKYRAMERASEGLSPSEAERVYYREAFAWIREHPVEWLWLEVKKLAYFWAPVGPSYSSHSRRYWIGHAASYLALLPFALAGFVRVVRRSEQPIVLWGLAGSALLTALIFFPLPRYRVPGFDPAMIVCAAFLLRHER
jgi:4-amino-4-deoxy-L-arabinose transferase-like glycosyltransferase